MQEILRRARASATHSLKLQPEASATPPPSCARCPAFSLLGGWPSPHLCPLRLGSETLPTRRARTQACFACRYRAAAAGVLWLGRGLPRSAAISGRLLRRPGHVSARARTLLAANFACTPQRRQGPVSACRRILPPLHCRHTSVPPKPFGFALHRTVSAPLSRANLVRRYTVAHGSLTPPYHECPALRFDCRDRRRRVQEVSGGRPAATLQPP